MPDLTELDRLIEQGLTLYGQGDLDGALLTWERALSLDPDNAQANSYVDYVRINYEMLTTEATTEGSPPFGIADDGEPEYTIEIKPGEELSPSNPAMHVESVNHDWFIDDETSGRHGVRAPAGSSGAPARLPSEMDLEVPASESGGVNFEDATREYGPSQRKAVDELLASEGATTEFQSEGTPGFGAQELTDVRRRELGFVKPRDPSSSSAPPTASPVAAPGRALTSSDDPPAPPPPPATAPIELSYSTSDLELPGGTDDLIASLPHPSPAPRVAAITRDLPSSIVPPHDASSAAVRLSIEEFDLGEPDLPPDLGVAMSSAPTREFVEKPTKELGPRSTEPVELLISAPTRELGLRGAGRAAIDDELGLQTSRSPGAPARPVDVSDQGTSADIVLPFDPIDARTAQILDEIDEDAPETEAKEDQTRRRITALLEHAASWAKEHELDRAVVAVDLALSEDPNSALAQKLIHRNREAIMAVFQGYLGDLERQPVLARPLHELASAPISPRAAFLLSRVDGMMSVDEILDVSGMPRLEAYRYLCQLFLRGILR